MHKQEQASVTLHSALTEGKYTISIYKTVTEVAATELKKKRREQSQRQTGQ